MPQRVSSENIQTDETDETKSADESIEEESDQNTGESEKGCESDVNGSDESRDNNAEGGPRRPRRQRQLPA